MMKKVRPWVEALGISEDDYQRWCSNIPADESVTFRCLREGRIPVEAYLDWACNFYELPVLKKAFFTNTPDHSLFAKLKSIGSWSREIMPIGEWDGVIYIACTEPNEDISWSFNVCYLLAPPEALESHWKALNSAQPIEAPPIPVMDEITKTAFPVLPDVAIPTVDPLALLKPKKSETVAAAPIAPPVVSEQLPVEQMAAPVLPEMPEHTSVTSIGMAAPTAAPVINKKDDPFAAIEMQLTQTGIKVPAAAAAPVLDIPEGFGAAGSFVPAAGLAVPDAFAALVPEGMAAPAAPVAKDAVPDGLALPDMPENTMTAVISKADANVSSAPVSVQDLNIMQTMAQEHFKELKNDFMGCMLLAFDGDNLKPIAWDEKWKTTGPKTAFISLSNASAFRVVYRTKMPYLGHVVETPSNSDFFSAWGFTALPESILVQPLIENGKWHGMLLLLADKAKKQSSQLATAEQVAARLANVMGKASIKKAA